MKDQNRTGWIATIGALAMLGLSFASVPLYQMFCQTTGYGGTPRKGIYPSGEITDREIIVRFNADVNSALPWSFWPQQKQVKIRAGEVGLAFYASRNDSSQQHVGMATYNVTPEKAAVYFNKIECFCFKEQVLSPHQEMDMPLQFFIDPDFARDPQMKDVTTITLSYTFFPFKGLALSPPK